jgi:hypothetical protein
VAGRAQPRLALVPARQRLRLAASLSLAARAYLRALGAGVVAERYVPRGRFDVEPLLSAIAATRADAVLLTLVGSDLVEFNRAFAHSPLAQRVLRLCPALEENGLLGVGGDATGELYATMGYFASVATDAGLDFVARYAARFGPLAPVPRRPRRGLLRRHVAAGRARVPGRLAGHAGAGHRSATAPSSRAAGAGP